MMIFKRLITIVRGNWRSGEEGASRREYGEPMKCSISDCVFMCWKECVFENELRAHRRC